MSSLLVFFYIKNTNEDEIFKVWQCFTGVLKQEHVKGFTGRTRLLSSWIINDFLNETY